MDREVSKLVYTDIDSVAYQFQNAVGVLLICQCKFDGRKLIPNVMSVYKETLMCLHANILIFTLTNI